MAYDNLARIHIFGITFCQFFFVTVQVQIKQYKTNLLSFNLKKNNLISHIDNKGNVTYTFNML